MDSTTNGADLVKGIQGWYRAQCNGDWEQSYGIAIETIDNPGWHVEVDLVGTPWANRSVSFARHERSAVDWVQFEIREAKFVGSGGIGNLDEILSAFLSIVRISS